MAWWHAVILGLVEGITEYLPISSTGHLILVSSLLGLDKTPEMKSAVDAFNVVIQGGAILAVLGLYRERVRQIVVGGLGLVKIGPGDPAGLRLGINLFLAFLPAAVLGVMLDDIIEARLFSTGPVLTALAVGGVYMILLDRWRARKASGEHGEDMQQEIDAVTPSKAVFIGFLQCIAMWPGTSRSMMTITGGVLVGLKPRAAAEFSFLLGLPTLGGACVYKLFKNLKQSHEAGTPNLFEVIGGPAVAIGIVVATISAAFAVKWLVGFLNKHGLAPFGWYRLALSAVLGGLILAGVVRIEVPAASVEHEAGVLGAGVLGVEGVPELALGARFGAEATAQQPGLRVDEARR
ncbi:MAG: undecaprenyl-diphosphate phosphatase [Planctomycetota bacterium]|nr:undecaprenyl-diphosphate phosphatase [Planctomycetota bacterium]